MHINKYGSSINDCKRLVSGSNSNKSAEKSPSNQRTERTSTAGVSILEKMRGQTRNSADVLENIRDTVSLGGSAASPNFTPGYSRALYNMGIKMMPR
jgi:hypothetical protein